VIGGHFESSLIAAMSASDKGSRPSSCILLAILEGVALLARIAKLLLGWRAHKRITLAISSFLSAEMR
jgi:hypothetical protein